MSAIAIEQTLLPLLPPLLAAALARLPGDCWRQATEIRLRAAQPVLILLGGTDYMLLPDGRLSQTAAGALICSREDIGKAMQLISRNSLYAFEQELQAGFITVGGGHRIGIAGQAIVDNGRLKALKNISSLNIRLAREQKGAADAVFPHVVINGKVVSSLIISPPRCGKTTLLRDLIRQISSGSPAHGFNGVQVGLVDERSELAGCWDGVPTVDLGPRVDVLDGCPKAVGMIMLVRSMAPQVVATDELGGFEDVQAVREALHAGVAVITTVHGRDAADAAGRPHIGALIQESCFERLIVLSDRPGIGTLETVTDGRSGRSLYQRQNGVKVCG
ncbi:MAG: stage III sporulation protein AA [Sporomusaceae bacterium]|nr:stage III sporulation protein AA [Sporomusaceae bacterium]